MLERLIILLLLLLAAPGLTGQKEGVAGIVTLHEVDISALADSFDTQAFIDMVRSDSTFYLAFKAMNYYPARFRGDLRVYKRGDKEKGYIRREATRFRQGQRMWVVIDKEQIWGKLKKRNGEFNYKTVEAWDEVFFPHDTSRVNLAGYRDFSRNKKMSAEQRHKQEVKELMFNPGVEISGVPLVGKKVGIFEENMQQFYDYSVYPGTYRDSINCLIFEAEAKSGFPEGKTVIKTLVTWFDQENYQVVKRELTLRYTSIPFDFNITIKVDNRYYKGILLPDNIDYTGFFNVVFMKKETVEFRIYDFDWLF